MWFPELILLAYVEKSWLKKNPSRSIFSTGEFFFWRIAKNQIEKKLNPQKFTTVKTNLISNAMSLDLWLRDVNWGLCTGIIRPKLASKNFAQ